MGPASGLLHIFALFVFIATAYGNSTEAVTVTKCCPLGKRITLSGCIPSNHSLELDFVDETPLFHEIITSNKCEAGSYLIESNEDGSKEFHLFSNGSIKLSLKAPEEYLPHQYCLDTFLLDDGTTKVLPLICFPPEEPTVHASYVHSIGCLISILFLLLSAGAYFLIGELKTIQGKILVVYWICLSFAFGCITKFTVPTSELSCTILGFLAHISFLLSFFWLNVFCFHTWISVTKSGAVNNEGKALYWYTVYGFGCPFFISAISLVIDFCSVTSSTHPIKPNIGMDKCWFQSKTALYIYFVGPIFILLIANFIFFFLTIYHLLEKKREDMTQSMAGKAPQLTLNRRKQIYIQGVFLFVAMGLNWILEFVAQLMDIPQGEDMPLFFWIVDTFNSLYGVMSFFVFVLLDDRVRRLVLDKLYFKRRYLMEGRRDSVNSDTV